MDSYSIKTLLGVAGRLQHQNFSLLRLNLFAGLSTIVAILVLCLFKCAPVFHLGACYINLFTGWHKK